MTTNAVRPASRQFTTALGFRPTRLSVYYGQTPYGRRIHLGEELQYEVGKNGRIAFVTTYCGANMKAWSDGSLPPPQRVDDFCRNCFRTLAWDFMRQGLAALAIRISKGEIEWK